jgi:hypothetical protein
MKPIGSEIITSQSKAASEIGTPHGGRGALTQSNSGQAAPRTVQEWQEAQRQQRLQISALDGQKAARRGAELRAILEVASAKIDRFGWSQMDKHVKDEICNDWCDVLSQYTLAEVRAGVAAVFAASGGKLKSINEFQVQEKIREAHAQIVARLPKQEPEPERKPVDRETAAQIMAKAGFAVNRMGDA